jgi:transcription termination/antitermination protein NusG
LYTVAEESPIRDEGKPKMGPTMRELCPNVDARAMTAGSDADIRMTEAAHGQRWYAVHVRHQHERQAERLLKFQGWNTLAPMYRSQRRWSDRTKDIELPLFPGYVFCQFSAGDRIRVEDTPGVLQIVKFHGELAPVEEHEVAAIQALMASSVRLTPWPFLKIGDRVRVERGPLRGLEGTLLRSAEGTRLIVSVQLLQRSVAAEVDPDAVTPLRVLAAGMR